MPSAPWACAATFAPYCAASSTAVADHVLGEFWGARHSPGRHHRAGGDQLDQVGATLKDAPHRPAYVVDRIDHAVTQIARHDVVDVGRQAR